MALLEDHGDRVTGDSAAQAVESPVGHKLRELRLARRMTLNAVASRAGISESFLSQIERGKATPRLQVLFRVAGVFELTPADLLVDKFSDTPVFVPKQGRRVIATEEYSKQRLIPHMVSSVEVLAGTFEPHMTAGPQYTHGDGDELLLVLTGTIRAVVGDQGFTMLEGDCLYYRTSMPHTLTNLGDETAEVLWIIAPPG